MESDNKQNNIENGYPGGQIKETKYLSDEQVKEINDNLELQYPTFEEFCEAIEQKKPFTL